MAKINLLNNRISKWFFYKYFGIPKDKEIFRLNKNAIHYWESRQEAKCRIYQFNLWDIPIVKRLKYLGLIGLAFLKAPFLFILATDTASTNNKDLTLDSYHHDSNRNDRNLELYDYGGWQVIRFIMQWTLPSGSGTISDVKLYVYKYGNVQKEPDYTANLHELSAHTDWGETTATWDTYDGSNAWTTGGGDYNATIIDSFTPLAYDVFGWQNWTLLGDDATNPLTLDWEDTVNLLAKCSNEVTYSMKWRGYRKEESVETTERPYLEITYTTTDTSNFFNLF